MRENLDTLLLRNEVKDRVWLGINLYSDEMDYSYMMDLLQRYHQDHVRISLTVPDFSACGEVDAMAHFRKRKGFLMEFFRKMDSIGVIACYDCNTPPYCIWTDEEKQWLEAYAARHPGNDASLAGYHSSCVPVVDILPNLQVVRCFGMSDFLKASLSDFAGIPDIIRYFVNEIDSVACKLSACGDCKSCYEKKARHCLAGCIGFKSSRVRACNEAIGRL